jgi:hypothetical protein
LLFLVGHGFVAAMTWEKNENFMKTNGKYNCVCTWGSGERQRKTEQTDSPLSALVFFFRSARERFLFNNDKELFCFALFFFLFFSSL